MKRLGSKQFVRSALVGIAATGCDLAALLVLVGVFGASELAANVPALLVGAGVQYVGNKYLAFEDRSRDHVRRMTLFAGVEAGTLALNALGFHVVVTLTSAPYPLVRALVTLAVYASFSFPLWRRVFRASPWPASMARRMR